MNIINLSNCAKQTTTHIAKNNIEYDDDKDLIYQLQTLYKLNLSNKKYFLKTFKLLNVIFLFE